MGTAKEASAWCGARSEREAGDPAFGEDPKLKITTDDTARATTHRLIATAPAGLGGCRTRTCCWSKVDALARRIFGVSSEALDPAQLQLLLQMPELTPLKNPAPLVVEKPKPMVAVRKHRAPRLPENLPVVEEVIDPEPVKEQPENWRCIGQEVSEQLDYEPGRFLRRRTVRRKYVHRTQADAVPILAPLPECLLERGLAAPGLLAHVLVSKYCDYLPLYRQEQIFAQRHKINLPRQTLARWVGLAADWLKPIYEHIRTGVMAGGYVQVDETPVNYLEPGNGKTKQGYLWTGSRPGGDVFFRWETSRAAACLDNIIPVNFTGTIQCDGSNAYRSFAADRKGAVALGRVLGARAPEVL